MLTATRTRTEDLLIAIRNWHPSHDNAMDGCSGLSSCFKNSENALTNKCRASVIDLLDQALDLIAEDQIEQQSEQAWLDRTSKPLHPYFSGMAAELDALTIRRVGA
jgi:hypothetical protein